MSTRYQLHLGDSLAVLPTLPESSVDAVVSDPPYELGFMGKGWDSSGIANNVELWRQVLRVLKPGGHLLAFSGTRTYHRMACAIEDAGFEIRDQIGWTYGSGFPKSMDVSKALDKTRDETHEAERRAVILTVTQWIAAARDAAGVTNRQIDEAFGTNGMAGHWTSSMSQPAVPTAEQWPKLLDLFRVATPPENVMAAIDEWLRIKGQPVPTWSLRKVTGHHEKPAAGQTWNANYGQAADPTAKERRDEPHTEAAKKWQGWGTALKPAWEPCVLARKPFACTVAENVVTHGTGALNIDACRIGADEITTAAKSASASPQSGIGKTGFTGCDASTHIGRWPANLIHDGSPEVVAMFPESDGQNGAVGPQYGAKESVNTFGDYGPRQNFAPRGDTGSAARFFYCAKASKHDRDEGLERFPLKENAEWPQSLDGNDSRGVNPRRNIHPTVKPTELMRYLCRLITPPGGTVLDPFMGSGSTGKAAMLEGFRFIGIDMTPEYLEIARARIEHAANYVEEVEKADGIVPIAKAKDSPQLDLFAPAAEPVAATA